MGHGYGIVPTTERPPLPDRNFVQGKPVARRGRKARDLPRETARLPNSVYQRMNHEVEFVKANLARFTMALSLLATMALTLGAGIRWW